MHFMLIIISKLTEKIVAQPLVSLRRENLISKKLI